MREKIFGKLTILFTLLMIAFMAVPTMVFASGSYNARLTSSSIYVGQSTNVVISTTNAAGKFTVS